MIEPFPIQKFPNEIQVEVLSKLKEKELIACRLVSHIWKHHCDYLLKTQRTSLCVCRAIGGYRVRAMIIFLLDNVLRKDMTPEAHFTNQRRRNYYSKYDF
ncbi:hypothetical protein B4U80_13777 [Leptotrombidium deliense]|uniref:F-box domain-containing protein n=1 Tax=Leptotrombidium deliense TaxID=299467 RepID=A0A443SF63_9ACAR|nr:hypothetical protein B4U80_13777 [Leptotrombidium deliense]